MSPRSEVVGTAVLRDYPLRLWAQQQERTEEMIREFQLLLSGQETGQSVQSPPAQLVELADFFVSRFGLLLDEINGWREEALQQGLDRIDSEVPLVDGTAELLERVRQVMEAVDEYCRQGDLLMLARGPEELALAEWTTAQLVGQLQGAAPTPWPGPFSPTDGAPPPLRPPDGQARGVAPRRPL